MEVPERDPAALAEALVALLDEPRPHPIAAAGAARVRERCDAGVVAAAKLAAMGL